MQFDNLTRKIEQFIQALVAIVLRRKEGNTKEAVELIQTASRFYLNTELSTLLSFTPEQMTAHFKTTANSLDTHKCVMCADLLYELALISEEQNQKEAARHLKACCLHLYRSAGPLDKPYEEKMNSLAAELES
jgi:hypothetical protein